MRHSLLLALLLASRTSGAGAAEAASAGAAMRYGPFLTCTVERPAAGASSAEKSDRPKSPAPPSPDALGRIVARKGIVIKLSEDDAAYVCFDTERVRMAAAWTDGFLDLSETNIGTFKGNRTGAGVIQGNIIFARTNPAALAPGVGVNNGGARGLGGSGEPDGKYRGLYLWDKRVVLHYEIAGCEVFDMSEWVARPLRPYLRRSFTVAPSNRPVRLHVMHAPAAPGEILPTDEMLDAEQPVGSLSVRDGAYSILLSSQTALKGGGLKRTPEGRIELVIPPHADAAHMGIALERIRGPIFGFPHPPRVQDLRACQAGGSARWPQVFSERGAVAANDAAYVIDTIRIPEENPWKSWMRLSAIDFFADGRAAVATFNGDVWLVSGLDKALERVTWKRFAVGLYEPLGLKVIDGKVYVHGRDQITRLHDMNNDGEADYYECFNNDRAVYPSYHAYAYDLQVDVDGNLLYVVGGAWLGSERPWHAALFKVSPDGKRTDIVATGFRAPNGMAVGPRGEISISDNQGNWIPASKISMIRPGGFYGFVADPRVEPDAKGPSTFDQPLCWIPQSLDNSSGGQVWAPAKWGPLGGRLLHTSYGSASLFAVLDERIGDVTQGGVVKLPLKFESGIMRGRFAPHDGQLYVVGLKGWQTSGAKDGCLQRVRYTGKPASLPTSLHIEKDAIAIRFSEALDKGSGVDPQNYAIEQWNYRWSSAYGSPELSLARPGVTGRDNVDIVSARLSDDATTVRLGIPGIKPVMQMQIKINVSSANGTPIQTTISNTIHHVPE